METHDDREVRRQFQRDLAAEHYPDLSESELDEVATLSPRSFDRWLSKRDQRAYIVKRYPSASEWQKDIVSDLSAAEFAIWKAMAEHGTSDMCRDCLQAAVGNRAHLGTNGSALLRNLRHLGFSITNGRRRTGCPDHPGPTTWQKLSPALPDPSRFVSRALYSKTEWEKITEALGDRDAFTGSSSRSLEVDHRTPVGRLGAEVKVDADDPDAIRDRYQLLTRDHNTQKREVCIQCQRDRVRPAFLDMPWWFAGDSRYDTSVGCDGCGWAYPEKWKAHLLEATEPN